VRRPRFSGVKHKTGEHKSFAILQSQAVSVALAAYLFIRLPRPCRGLISGRRGLTNKILVLQSLSNNQGKYVKEPLAIGTFAVVESERLFVKVAKQMEWFDADIRSADRPL